MLEESDTTTRYWRSDMFSTNSSQTFQVPTPAEGILYLPSSLAGFTQHSRLNAEQRCISNLPASRRFAISRLAPAIPRCPIRPVGSTVRNAVIPI